MFNPHAQVKESRAHTTLWRKLKNPKLMGCTFRQNITLNTHTVDFFCKEVGLVILIDEEDTVVDPMRDDSLLSLGLTVLHLDPQTITMRPASAIEQIRDMIASMKSVE